jgi:hypothetical protein
MYPVLVRSSAVRYVQRGSIVKPRELLPLLVSLQVLTVLLLVVVFLAMLSYRRLLYMILDQLPVYFARNQTTTSASETQPMTRKAIADSSSSTTEPIRRSIDQSQ